MVESTARTSYNAEGRSTPHDLEEQFEKLKKQHQSDQMSYQNNEQYDHFYKSN